MITTEQLLEHKNAPAEFSKTLTPEEVAFLVDLLAEKNDEIRYAAFLTLQQCAQAGPQVFIHWDALVNRLDNENSYQRSLGAMLLAENARWDTEGRFTAILERYLVLCDDEKFVTARQSIQALLKVLPCQPQICTAVVDKLIGIDLMQRKDTQRKLLLLDICSVLAAVQRIQPDERIPAYVLRARTGGLLDQKALKQLAAWF